VRLPQKNASQTTLTPPVIDDDYAAEELVFRALASSHDNNSDQDVIDRFSSSAERIELSPHLRIARLKPSLRFSAFNLFLKLRLRLLKHQLYASNSTETFSLAQIKLAKQCKRLLYEIEFGRVMPAHACRAAKSLAAQCNWNSAQLRTAVILGTVVPANGPGSGIELKKPGTLHTAAVVGTGLLLLMVAAFFGIYGVTHFVHCGGLDCASFGSFYISSIGFSLGLIPIQSSWMRARLYNEACKQLFL
jgi:hypothetical protein